MQTSQEFNVIKTLDYKIDLPKAEKHYKAKFVGEFAIRDIKGNWLNQPFALFYVKEPAQPEYSNYFGLFINASGHTMITDGKSAADHTWTGMVLENGVDVIYSRYRHDYITGADGEMVDGGPNYNRCSFSKNSRLVNINIIDGELKVSEKWYTILFGDSV